MLNNKGQSLILFVLVLPILMLILILVIDVGKAITLKHELNNINEIVLDYGLDNINSESLQDELISLIKLNKKDIDNISIDINGDKIYINMNDRCDGLFLGLLNKDILKVKTSYVGYIQDREKRIERIGD